MSSNFAKPVLILVHGIPGAGKSAFARQFSEQYGLTHVNSDRIRFELYDDAQFSPSENKLVFDLSYYMTEELLKAGRAVLFDMLIPTQKIRNQLAELAKKYRAEYLIVWLQTDAETAHDRSTQRDRRRPDDKYSFSLATNVFERLATVNPLGDRERYVVISGKYLYRQQAQVVANKLRNIGVWQDVIPAFRRPSRPEPSRPPLTRTADQSVRDRAN